MAHNARIAPFSVGFHTRLLRQRQGEKVGVGFRAFAGTSTSDSYGSRIRDRSSGYFSDLHVFGAFGLLTFSVGMFLSVLLQQPDIRFRRTYRTLFILPYAVPGVLSILILKVVQSGIWGRQ
jgi:arabinogalactan oligomer/maltooligosaccharide transport system permease protein